MSGALTLSERLGYAAKGAVAGIPVGGLGWWLYGAAHSLNYSGPEMDPVLRHWIVLSAVTFAIVGFSFGPILGLAVKDTLMAIFHFEIGSTPQNVTPWLGLVLLVIILAAIWFSVPAHA